MGTTRLSSRRRQDQGFKWARICIAVLSTIGVIDTGSITLSRWGWIGALSCPGGTSGCNQVLNSPWGRLFTGDGFEVPLSFLGLLAYLSVLLMALLPLLPVAAENKGDLSRRTWWGIFTVSLCMSAFSLVLLWLMHFRIGAFCFFCLLSACLSFAVFVFSCIGGNWEDRGKMIFRGGLLSIGVLLGGLIWASALDPSKTQVVSQEQGTPPIVQAQSTPAKLLLAKYLTASGVVNYSAYWCPHCHDQKELFGKEAVEELKIIECAEDGRNSQRSLCQRKGIEGFPSWEINGEIYSGVKSLNKLADMTKYKGSRDF